MLHNHIAQLAILLFYELQVMFCLLHVDIVTSCFRRLLAGHLPRDAGRRRTVPVPGGSRSARRARDTLQVCVPHRARPSRATQDSPGRLPGDHRGPGDRVGVRLLSGEASRRGEWSPCTEAVLLLCCPCFQLFNVG